MGAPTVDVPLEDVLRALSAGETVVDVREPVEFESGHLPGSRSLPSTVLRERLWELPRGRRVWLVCATGARSRQSAEWLRAIGYEAFSARDGLRSWSG